MLTLGWALLGLIFQSRRGLFNWYHQNSWGAGQNAIVKRTIKWQPSFGRVTQTLPNQSERLGIAGYLGCRGCDWREAGCLQTESKTRENASYGKQECCLNDEPTWRRWAIVEATFCGDSDVS